MASYDSIKSHQAALIRKAVKGSFFIAPETSPGITALTAYTAGPPVVIDLVALPTGWKDLGLLTSDGVSASNEVTTSEISSWGITTPTRTDVVSDTTTLSVTAQETNALTIGLFTGATVPATTANSGELGINKPARPSQKFWRGLLLAIDESDEGDVYVARYFPRLKVTGRSDQNFSGGDEPITWGVTFQTFVDEAVGYSERYIFGGPGWLADKTEMGLT